MIEKIEFKVSTVKGGYEVKLDDQKLMYFNKLTLLEGLFVRVWMQRTDSLTIHDIETMVNATLDGGLVRQLQSEIMQLKDERAVLKNEIRTLKRKIKELKY